MTLETLKTNTRKELAALAKRHRVAGWHGMRKEELIEALLDVHRSKISDPAPTVRSVARVKAQRQNPKPPLTRPSTGGGSKGFSKATARTSSNRQRTTRSRKSISRMVRRDISTAESHESVREEFAVTAHDPFWIDARWVLKRSTVQRAEAALRSDWFRAKPVIRVFAVKTDETNGASAQWLRDVEIHGECDHWFVPVENPPNAYKLEIGYATSNGKFFALAKSRKVTTPKPGSRAAERLGIQRNGNGRSVVTDPEFEKFLAARATSYGTGPAEAHGHSQENGATFSLDAELVVSGTARPDAQLSVQGESVKVGKDGRFTTRVSVADGRQSIPAICVSLDGTEKRTIFLSVERNAKNAKR